MPQFGYISSDLRLRLSQALTTAPFILLLLPFGASGFGGSIAHVSFHGRPAIFLATTPSSKTRLCMALTPIGPFCPFRSTAAVDMDPRMESIQAQTPEFATEMARIQLDMQAGQPPDPARLRRVASGIDAAVTEWETLLARLNLSDDFQTREYAKLTQAHLQKHGQTSSEIVAMMRWQSSCMNAMADNRPPPPPPPEMNLMAMMAEAQKAQAKEGGDERIGPPSMSAMTSAEKITTTPFTGKEPAFDSSTVREEYEALCRDHGSLIEMGATYAQFDPLGKLSYIDELQKIEDRWDVFFARFSLLGQINSEFVSQCNAFLKSMNMNESDFRDLIHETHEIMKRDAERERDQVVP